MYAPIVAVFGAIFLAIMIYLVGRGFDVTGSVFGKSGAPNLAAQQSNGSIDNVQGGGPPAAVMVQLKTLRDRIAAHPHDDVALTQLGDMYLAVNKFSDAIPLYQRALKANPHNVAAQTGLEQAKSGLAQTQSQ
ncbi:MAG TPA: tetratricopeptide repeat protein [Candidatus Baltobacteraceae bacterium]|jgi:tetratricopeptide (TPR) repeat protein|nr:tetratricopeptide repeat protein [Candidatus Baltobacteraceae bacterium]